MSFFDKIRQATRGAEFGPPTLTAKHCKKCGDGSIQTRYVQSRDRLAHRCSGCGYEWSSPPLDRQIQ